MTFRRAGLVAALPYALHRRRGTGRSGYFNPSNICVAATILYAFVLPRRSGRSGAGACLLRRPLDGGPGDWRAWDGAGFTVRFADPYREDCGPARHVCTPVEGNRAHSRASSKALPGGYLAVTAATAPGR